MVHGGRGRPSYPRPPPSPPPTASLTQNLTTSTCLSLPQHTSTHSPPTSNSSSTEKMVWQIDSMKGFVPSQQEASTSVVFNSSKRRPLLSGASSSSSNLQQKRDESHSCHDGNPFDPPSPLPPPTSASSCPPLVPGHVQTALCSCCRTL